MAIKKPEDVRNKTWYPKAEAHVNTEKTCVDMGAFVVVVNADKVVVLGKKRIQKLYRMHSGRPSGMTVETFDQLQQRIPERIVEHATIWQDSNTLNFRELSPDRVRRPSAPSRSQTGDVQSRQSME
ncbi:50S ribosomal protein L13, chloroplastic-like protein isoform X2 [Tanacetum coccineum]